MSEGYRSVKAVPSSDLPRKEGLPCPLSLFRFRLTILSRFTRTGKVWNGDVVYQGSNGAHSIIADKFVCVFSLLFLCLPSLASHDWNLDLTFTSLPSYKRHPIRLHNPFTSSFLNHYRLKVPRVRAVLEYFKCARTFPSPSLDCASTDLFALPMEQLPGPLRPLRLVPRTLGPDARRRRRMGLHHLRRWYAPSPSLINLALHNPPHLK
jgi:hypothetical protein